MEKGKKRAEIDEKLCRHVEILMKGGANGVEVAEMLDISPVTVSRIKNAGFNYEAFLERNQLRRKKEREKEKEPAEGQIQGQMEMDLKPAEEKPEHEETLGDMQTKMMRFQAHQADRIVKAIEENAVMLNTKLDRLNDTLGMILRAVRKE